MSNFVVHKLDHYGDNSSSYNINFSRTGKLLCVRNQHNRPVIYYLTDTLDPDQQWVEVRAFYTGQVQKSEGWIYLDTVMLDNGDFVLHFFYRKT